MLIYNRLTFCRITGSPFKENGNPLFSAHSNCVRKVRECRGVMTHLYSVSINCNPLDAICQQRLSVGFGAIFHFLSLKDKQFRILVFSPAILVLTEAARAIPVWSISCVATFCCCELLPTQPSLAAVELYLVTTESNQFYQIPTQIWYFTAGVLLHSSLSLFNSSLKGTAVWHTPAVKHLHNIKCGYLHCGKLLSAQARPRLT